MDRRRFFKTTAGLLVPVMSSIISPKVARAWSHGVAANLFLSAGQSNEGDNNALVFADLPSNLQSVDGGIKIWNGSAFVTLQNGVNSNLLSSLGAGNFANWGPASEFGRQWRIDHPSSTLYWVHFAAAGTSLGGATNAWNSANSGQLFDQMTTYVNGAKSALSSAKVRALLWMQGEADAQDSSLSTAYATNLPAFLTKVRTAWGDANTRILIGRISTYSGFTFPAAVRNAQDAAAGGQNFTIDTDSFPRQSSNTGIHYDATGQVNLGSAMYAAYKT